MEILIGSLCMVLGVRGKSGGKSSSSEAKSKMLNTPKAICPLLPNYLHPPRSPKFCFIHFTARRSLTICHAPPVQTSSPSLRGSGLTTSPLSTSSSLTSSPSLTGSGLTTSPLSTSSSLTSASSWVSSRATFLLLLGVANLRAFFFGRPSSSSSPSSA